MTVSPIFKIATVNPELTLYSLSCTHDIIVIPTAASMFTGIKNTMKLP